MPSELSAYSNDILANIHIEAAHGLDASVNCSRMAPTCICQLESCPPAVAPVSVITTLRAAAIIVDLARLTPPRCQPGMCAASSGMNEALRLVDRGTVSVDLAGLPGLPAMK